jgi:integrator complex subunit 6
MAEPADQTNKDGTSRISRLDVAKMAVENICRSRDKSIVNHNATILNAAKLAAARQQQFVGRLEQFDEFMLLSTSLQSGGSPNNTEGRKRNSSLDETDTSGKRSRSSSFHSTESLVEMHSTCGAGGRLLVGCVDGTDSVPFGGAQPIGMVPHPPNRADFEREVKRLRSAALPTMSSNSSSKHVFPDSAGGAIGLSTALSHGLGLLSRYRLTRGSIVENFGMGRLPWFEHQMVGFKDKNEHNATKNVSPLQPACLVLVTDGECLHLPQEKGGGVLRLQFGNAPLREFYKERE